MNNEQDEFEYEPTDLESGIMSLVKVEVDKQVIKFTSDFEWYKDQYTKTTEKYLKLTNEHKELQKKIGHSKEFEIFRSQINENNISAIVGYLNLQSINIDFSGTHDEEIPQWFRLITTHYPDRIRIFALMYLFEVKYPAWAKKFKLPFDYGEAELDLIFSKLGKMYVCNGNIFSGNMGFHYRYIKNNSGDLNSLFKNESYVEIPWNLLLQNKLLVTEKYFEKINAAIKKKVSHSEYFYKIQDYQVISPEQAIALFEYLPVNNLYDIHKTFIKNNRDILKLKPELAEEFRGKMEDNQYSTFYFLNYPLYMQKEFIRSYKGRYDSKFDLVKKMNISKEEKMEFLAEITDTMLDQPTK